MAQLFRSDGWVKTTLGPAVTGAAIYVCNQPVTDIADIPPAPLAQLFSDSLGQNTLPQPVTTDGFGHYDFYIATGTYTVVIVYNGKIQQVYPDQSIGGTGSGTFTLNSLSGNVSIAAGTNVSVAVVGSSILISSSAGAGGVTSLNSLTGAVNVTAGSGISISVVGSSIQVNNTAQGTVHSTSGSGWFVGPGIIEGISNLGSGSTFSAPITNYNGNVVVVIQFVLEGTWTLSSVSYQLLAAGSAGETFNLGIYDSNKNKLIDAQFNANSTSLQNVSFSSVTLPGGTYFFAFSDSASSSSAHGPAQDLTSVSGIQQLIAIANSGPSPKIATAANAASGGALPSTLGTLTGVSIANFQSYPVCAWFV